MAVAFPCVNISVCWGCNRLGSWNSRSYFSHSSGGWKTRSGYKHVRVLGRALFLTCRQQPSLPVFTWPFSACIHCFCCSVAKSCLSLCDPMDCRTPGSSVHVILQARILEWVTIAFSRESSWPRDRTKVSCIAGGFFIVWATRENQEKVWGRVDLCWKNLINTPQPGDQHQHPPWQVEWMAWITDIICWEGPFVSTVSSFLKSHHLGLFIRKTPDKPPLRDIPENFQQALCKTVRVIKNKNFWETVLAKRFLRGWMGQLTVMW